MDTLLIFAGGPDPGAALAGELPEADLTIAADGGYDVAVGLGMPVDVVVGDFDSISGDPLPRHVIVERYPVDKDHTDLELAMELAIREDPTRLVVAAGTGGRHDHELAIAELVCSERWKMIDEIDWISERSRAHVVRRRRLLHGDVGATVSLLAMGGPAGGITTRGLRWEWQGETLHSGSSHGVSNVLKAPVVDIRLEYGCLLVVFPT